MLTKVLKLLILLGSSLVVECYDLNQLTLEEKVGQLFITYFEGENVNEKAVKLLQEAKLGGIIFYNKSNALHSPAKVKQLSHDLQNLAKKECKIPLFIAVDQEGGIVSRLNNGFTLFPGNGALGQTKSLQLAYQSCKFIGDEIGGVGINLNFAPVVDVNNNPQNPIIGIRSFGNNREIVSKLGKASLEGFKSSGIIPCIKHFPGHGDVAVDSHEQLPIVNKNLDQLKKLELFPFIKLKAITPMIMTAHILFPQLDKNHCATLSSFIIQKILRDDLKFNGVVITDSLTMKGVTQKNQRLEEIAVQAFEAGNDILLIGGRDPNCTVTKKEHHNEVIRVYKHLLNAVKTGKITEERVNASVKRILDLKKNYKLFFSSKMKPLQNVIRKNEHLNLSKLIASKALTVKQNRAHYNINNLAIIAPEFMKKAILKSQLISLGKSTQLITFKELSPLTRDTKKIMSLMHNLTDVIFCSYDCWKHSNQINLLRSIALSKPTIQIALRSPLDIEKKSGCTIKIATHSPTKPSLEAAAEKIYQLLAH